MIPQSCVYLQESCLVWGDVVQGDKAFVCVLIYQHGVSVAERPAPHILPTDTHVEPCGEKYLVIGTGLPRYRII